MISVITQYRGGGGRFATPHDSTIGVGAGFYWFAAFFLLFIVLGVLKAFWDDKQWHGKTIRFKGKARKK
jgi:hypothetical protein